MKKIGLVKESAAYETRVALSPEIVGKLRKIGYEICVESGAGLSSSFPDEAYLKEGALIEKDRFKILKTADMITTVSGLQGEDILSCKKNAVLIGILKPSQTPSLLDALNKSSLTSFSLEKLPRITRAQSMDVLSSQSNLAGYRAVIEGVFHLNRAMPMMMTAAGTIRPSRVLVMGAGVAGLQAIATAKRLGAIVSAFDVRPSVKEQVESLGGIFIEVDLKENGEGKSGYAQEMSQAYQNAQHAKLQEVISGQDLVITTALIPGKKAPILITEPMVFSMKQGAVIVDIASEMGGNCSLSVHGKTVISSNGVTVHAPFNLLTGINFDASQTFARNLFTFISSMLSFETGNISFDVSDEIIKGTLLTHNGKTVHSDFVTSGLSAPTKPVPSEISESSSASKTKKKTKDLDSKSTSEKVPETLKRESADGITAASASKDKKAKVPASEKPKAPLSQKKSGKSKTSSESK